MRGEIEHHNAIAGAFDRADMRFAIGEGAAGAAIGLQLNRNAGDRVGPAGPRSLAVRLVPFGQVTWQVSPAEKILAMRRPSSLIAP